MLLGIFLASTPPSRDDTKIVDLVVVEEHDKESSRAPTNVAPKEANYFLIDTITQDNDVEHEKDSGKH